METDMYQLYRLADMDFLIIVDVYCSNQYTWGVPKIGVSLNHPF